MEKKAFCPFINGDCKNDCVFNCGHFISLNGYSTPCELSAFVQCVSDDDLSALVNQLKELNQKK